MLRNPAIFPAIRLQIFSKLIVLIFSAMCGEPRKIFKLRVDVLLLDDVLLSLVLDARALVAHVSAVDGDVWPHGGLEPDPLQGLGEIAP